MGIHLIYGWFLISALSFDNGQYNVLFDNCPTQNSCKYKSYNISHHLTETDLKQGQYVFLKGMVNCRKGVELESRLKGSTFIPSRQSYFCDSIYLHINNGRNK